MLYITGRLYCILQVERCNYMLGAFIKLAESGADYSDRTLAHLLTSPTNDGGQWQMLVNLIEKYGLMPHCQWPSPFLAENSRRLAAILDNQVKFVQFLLIHLHTQRLCVVKCVEN